MRKENTYVHDSTTHLNLLGTKNFIDRIPDNLGSLRRINGRPNALFLVVLDHGAGLLVEGGEALSKRLGIVVGSLDKGLAGHVVSHRLLGRTVTEEIGSDACTR